MKAELVELSRATDAILSRRGVVLIRGDRVFRLDTRELAKLIENADRTQVKEPDVQH